MCLEYATIAKRQTKKKNRQINFNKEMSIIFNMNSLIAYFGPQTH